MDKDGYQVFDIDLTDLSQMHHRYVDYELEAAYRKFMEVKDDEKPSNTAFLIHMFLSKGSSIEAIKRSLDKATANKLKKLQRMYNLKSHVVGPETLTLKRVAAVFPTIVAATLYNLDGEIKRAVSQSELKKLTGVEFPVVLMSSLTASLIPRDTKFIREEDSQKLRNAIALYTAVETQKTLRFYAGKSLIECLHASARVVTIVYQSMWVSEEERQSAFKEPYFSDIFINGSVSENVQKISNFVDKLVAEIRVHDIFFRI